MSDPAKKTDKSNIEVPPELQSTVHITAIDKIYNWGRRNSVWPMMFGLACCAIEMIARLPAGTISLALAWRLCAPAPARPT